MPTPDEDAIALAANVQVLVLAFESEIPGGTMGTPDERAAVVAYEAECANLIAGGGPSDFIISLTQLASAFVVIDQLLTEFPPSPGTPTGGGRLDGSDASQSGVNAIFL